MTSPDTRQPTRGGNWDLIPRGCRSTRRAPRSRRFLKGNTGFRVVCLPRRVVCLPREVAPPRMLLRGGAWCNPLRDCRSTTRSHVQTGGTGFCFGFRVVCLPRGVAP